MIELSRPRFAIYFTPAPDSALWRFGSSVIGYDAYTGESWPEAPSPALAAMLGDTELAEPRRYGFHATLRAPFELAPQNTVEQVLERAAALAARCVPVAIGRLRPIAMGRFIALACAAAPIGLSELAADCVRTFEALRAPLSGADRARRLKAPLTARQLAHLEAWGYPYVFEDFIFHMTLTGPLEERRRTDALAQIFSLYAAVDSEVVVDGLSVLEQPERTQPFRVLARYPLAGG